MINLKMVIKNKKNADRGLFFAIVISIVFIVNVFAVSVFVSAFVSAGELGNGFNIRTSREFVDVSGTGASGKADIQSITTSNGLNNVKINLNLNGLERYVYPSCKKTSCRIVYEAWLIDTDTGYALSLGAFTPNKAEKANVRFQQKQVNFLVYDFIAITEKLMDSEIPDSGNILMFADITGRSGI